MAKLEYNLEAQNAVKSYVKDIVGIETVDYDGEMLEFMYQGCKIICHMSDENSDKVSIKHQGGYSTVLLSSKELKELSNIIDRTYEYFRMVLNDIERRNHNEEMMELGSVKRQMEAKGITFEDNKGFHAWIEQDHILRVSYGGWDDHTYISDREDPDLDLGFYSDAREGICIALDLDLNNPRALADFAMNYIKIKEVIK